MYTLEVVLSRICPECGPMVPVAVGGGARMPARSVYLVTLSLSEAGPGRFGGQISVTDIYHTIPYRGCGVTAAVLVPVQQQGVHKRKRHREGLGVCGI